MQKQLSATQSTKNRSCHLPKAIFIAEAFLSLTFYSGLVRSPGECSPHPLTAPRAELGERCSLTGVKGRSRSQRQAVGQARQPAHWGKGPEGCCERLPHMLGLTRLHSQYCCSECRAVRRAQIHSRKLCPHQSQSQVLRPTPRPLPSLHGRMGAISCLLGTVRLDSEVGRGSGRGLMCWESAIGDIHGIKVLHTTIC